MKPGRDKSVPSNQVEIKHHMKPGRYKTFPSNKVEIKLHINQVEIKLPIKSGRYKTFLSNQVEINTPIRSGGDETIKPSKDKPCKINLPQQTRWR